MARIGIVACAGRSADSPSARAFAASRALEPMGYDQMLEGDTVDVVLVLTSAQVHLKTVLNAEPWLRSPPRAMGSPGPDWTARACPSGNRLT